MILALAIGFHKANQLDLAMPWAEKAAGLFEAPVAHLHYGDLLLSVAQATKDPAQARTFFERAVEQYDLVLKAQSTSVEATNNKAWVLHKHLGDSRGALELGGSGLLQRSDPVGSSASSSTPWARPGGRGADPRRRGLLWQGAPQGARQPGPQLPHGQASPLRAQPQGDHLPRKGLRRAQPALARDGRRGCGHSLIKQGVEP